MIKRLGLLAFACFLASVLSIVSLPADAQQKDLTECTVLETTRSAGFNQETRKYGYSFSPRHQKCGVKAISYLCYKSFVQTEFWSCVQRRDAPVDLTSETSDADTSTWYVTCPDTSVPNVVNSSWNNPCGKCAVAWSQLLRYTNNEPNIAWKKARNNNCREELKEFVPSRREAATAGTSSSSSPSSSSSSSSPSLPTTPNQSRAAGPERQAGSSAGPGLNPSRFGILSEQAAKLGLRPSTFNPSLYAVPSDPSSCVKFTRKEFGGADIQNMCDQAVNVSYCSVVKGSERECFVKTPGNSSLGAGVEGFARMYASDTGGLIHWSACVHPLVSYWRGPGDIDSVCR